MAALRTELTRCGAQVVEQGDTLTILPSANRLHGAEIETYDDHRLAMCFAILGLKVPGIKIKNPSCVKKTFPNFFQKLAAPPPAAWAPPSWTPKPAARWSGDELLADVTEHEAAQSSSPSTARAPAARAPTRSSSPRR